MRKIPLCFILAYALNGFAQEETLTSVAVLRSEGNALGNDELDALTDEIRGVALQVLPGNSFAVLPQDLIIKRLGGAEKYLKECSSDTTCVVGLGKKAQVDYVAQATVSNRFKIELYKVSTGGLVGMLTDDARDYKTLLSVVKKKAPELFGKIPGAAKISKSSSYLIEEGIGGVQVTGEDYDFGAGKRYLVSLSTEPPGAVPSFDGIGSAKCLKTPCKLSLEEGSVRIMANLEQYEIADTTVFIKQNNQSIEMTLKPNFGFLEIEPAYLDGIGEQDDWALAINNKIYDSFENRLSPGNYNVKLSHECYELVSFVAGINKGKREVFDMANHIRLKKGGLVLNAERNGELAIEPVFVNGVQAGETPFANAVPLCAEIRIGENMESVDVSLKYNNKVEYTHKMSLYESKTTKPQSKPAKISFWAAIGLDVLGAVFVYAGYSKDKAMEQAYNEEYRGHGSDFDTAWENVENNRRSRNALYVIGGLVLASGIGVHIWF